MEIITIIDTSDDESDCIEVNDRSDKVRQVKEVGIGASSAAAAPVHPVESECDGDESNDDSSSSFSSDDSIWNVTGLLSSLGVATRNNNNAGASSCSSTSSGSDEDAHVGNDTSPLCIISPSTNDKNQSDNDDDGSISSGDSIWNETGLLSRTTIIDEVENSTRTCPHLPKNNGYTNNVMKSMDSEACTNRKCSTIRSTDIEGNDDILSPDVPLHADGTWMIVLLMDHREFGCANNYLQTVEKNINNHFGGIYSEITTLPSADYMFVARLISNATGDILDERVLDMVIERKNVQDVCNCLISDSKKYKPLSFFEAQMYKLQHCGITKKLFLMEGDEDRTRNFFVGARSEMEKAKRLKRVKTIR